MRLPVRLFIVPALILGGAAGCASDRNDAIEEGAETCWEESRLPSDATRVEITLREWSIEMSEPVVKAGNIGFVATNQGTMTHEMLVVRSSDPAALPRGADGSIDENLLAADDVIGEIAEFPMNGTCAHNFNLEPGNYVLFCNIAEGDAVHVMRGMVRPFSVVA
ncbi:MAG: hypothetical protein RL219_2101 [Actinomycetota bacterium]|jgi:hypothetical protein